MLRIERRNYRNLTNAFVGSKQRSMLTLLSVNAAARKCCVVLGALLLISYGAYYSISRSMVNMLAKREALLLYPKRSRHTTPLI